MVKLAKQRAIVRYYPSTKKRSYRRRASKKKHRVSRQIPILKTMGLLGSALVPGKPGYTAPVFSWINAAKGVWGFDHAFADTMVGYVGYDFRNNSWNVPMGTVMVILGSFASKIVSKFAGNKPFRGLPIISRFKF